MAQIKDRYCPILSPPSRKSPPLRLHLLHPIPSFSLGRASVFTSKLHLVTLLWAPLSSVRHSRFDHHRGRLVAPEPANYVYVPGCGHEDTASNRPVAVPCCVPVRACQSQHRSTLCSAHSFLACSCTSRLSFRPRSHSPKTPWPSHLGKPFRFSSGRSRSHRWSGPTKLLVLALLSFLHPVTPPPSFLQGLIPHSPYHYHYTARLHESTTKRLVCCATLLITTG